MTEMLRYAMHSSHRSRLPVAERMGAPGAYKIGGKLHHFTVTFYGSHRYIAEIPLREGLSLIRDMARHATGDLALHDPRSPAQILRDLADKWEAGEFPGV